MMEIQTEMQKYKDMDCFIFEQLLEIEAGLGMGVDVSQYAKPWLSVLEMESMRNSLALKKATKQLRWLEFVVNLQDIALKQNASKQLQPCKSE